MNRRNGFSAVKQGVNEYAERSEPLLPALSDADTPPEWWPGTAEEWRQAVNAAFPAMRGRAILGFLEMLSKGWTPTEAGSGVPARGTTTNMGGYPVRDMTPGASPEWVKEANRLLQALYKDPEAMRHFDQEPGRRHALVELAGGAALLGPSTRAEGLCRAARESLGELPEPAPVVKAAPEGPTLTRSGLAAEARVLRRNLKADDYKELALQVGSNIPAVRKDLIDIAQGREDGSILSAARLVDLAKKVLAIPAGAR